MGAKGWMLLYAHGEIRPILQSAPPIDREATREFVARVYPSRRLVEIGDGDLYASADPPDQRVYAACFSGLSVLCTSDVGLDRPSLLDQRFRDEAGGRTLYLHAMRGAVNWFAYAIWNGEGALRRSLSLCPEFGIMEDLGDPLPFETPYWSGERVPEDEDDDAYPLMFHPRDLADDALRTLFGFNGDGFRLEDDPDLEKVVLAGFVLRD